MLDLEREFRAAKLVKQFGLGQATQVGLACCVEERTKNLGCGSTRELPAVELGPEGFIEHAREGPHKEHVSTTSAPRAVSLGSRFVVVQWLGWCFAAGDWLRTRCFDDGVAFGVTCIVVSLALLALLRVPELQEKSRRGAGTISVAKIRAL